MGKKSTFNAARATARIFGVLAGLGGLTHGVGEVLQGNVKPKTLVIDSWTKGPIAAYMGGEPGMTLVPNLLLTGILCILVSLAVVARAATVRDKKGGRGLLLLSVLMMLVGGGFGPPIIGILAGLAGTGIGATSSRRRERLPAGLGRFLAALWPWVFGLAVLNGFFLVVGSVILVYAFGLNNPDLFVNSFFFSVLSLLLAVPLGRVYDSQMREPGLTARPAVSQTL